MKQSVNIEKLRVGFLKPLRRHNFCSNKLKRPDFNLKASRKSWKRWKAKLFLILRSLSKKKGRGKNSTKTKCKV